MRPIEKDISLAAGHFILPWFLRQWDYGPDKPFWQLVSIHAVFPSCVPRDVILVTQWDVCVWEYHVCRIKCSRVVGAVVPGYQVMMEEGVE